MINIRDNCLSKKADNNEYIELGSIIIECCIATSEKLQPLRKPLVLDTNETTGQLTVNGVSINYKPLIANPVLYEFLQLAKLHNHFYFYTSYKYSILRINVYARLNFSNNGIFVPSLCGIDPKINYPANFDLQICKNVPINKKYKNIDINLFTHQKNNLEWMIEIEALIDTDRFYIEYPELMENSLLINNNRGGVQCLYNKNTFYIYPIEKIAELPIQKHLLKGGMLCDSVGLGKTISMYSLILNKLEREIEKYNRPLSRAAKSQITAKYKTVASDDPSTIYKTGATLIIVPARLIGQWRDEFDKILKPPNTAEIYTISTIVQYNKCTPEVICNSDIIITSYRFFENFRYNQSSVKLNNYFWERIILDEAHELMTTRVINILSILKSKYRWICTGTPFPYRDIDLDYYLRFLTNCEYKSECTFFENSTTESIISQCTRHNTLQSVKNEVNIPPVAEETIFLTQDPVERAMYINAAGNQLQMIQLCTNILVAGGNLNPAITEVADLEEIRCKMIEMYTSENIKLAARIVEYNSEITTLQDLLKDLEGDELAAKRSAISAKRKMIRECESRIAGNNTRKNVYINIYETAKEEDCVICCDPIEDLVMTKCSHIFCRDCMTKIIHTSATSTSTSTSSNKMIIRCPYCKTELNINLDIGYLNNKKDDGGGGGSAAGDAEYKKNITKWGTKTAWLVKYLHNLLQSDSNARIIIYSQWDKMLKLVGIALKQEAINYFMLQGSSARLNSIINQFKKSSDNRILLLSSDRCNSGSNLTEASHIILLDTVNGTAIQQKSVENQAIGRASRLGQDKIVKVIRLVMKDTIEEEYYTRSLF